jgi:hypothetical protein
MPGGIVVEPLSKRERDKYMKQMTEVVRSLKRMDARVEKLVKLTEKVLGQLGGR